MLATCSPDVLDAVAQTIGAPCFVIDAHYPGTFRVAAINARARVGIGVLPDGIVGGAVTEIFPPVLADAIEAACRRCVDTGEPGELEMPPGTGTLKSLWQVSLVPLLDGAGKVVRILGTGRDIPACRRAWQARQDSEICFRAMFETAAVGIAITDRTGGFRLVNAALQQMLGHGEAELRRLGWLGVTHPDDVGRMLAQAARLTEGRADRVTLEQRCIRRDGGILWVKLTAVPARLGEEAAPVIIGVVEDITSHKAAERTLIRAKEEAERLSLAKTRFLAAASHDLRQPLQAMLLFHDVLGRLNHDPALQGIIDRMGQSLAGQKAMIETLLDMSKLDAGAVAAQPVGFPVGSLFRRLADEFGPVAADAGLGFRWVESAAEIRSDPLLLERILRNLLANAVKYSERGRVLLGCRRAGRELRIQVLDTGIGIEERHLPAIFEEFYQADDGTAERRGGLGLGLSIVDRLARLLGHRVVVRSRRGRGSCFEVIVPLCPVSVGSASADGTVERPGAAAKRPIVSLDADSRLPVRLRRALEGPGYAVIEGGRAGAAKAVPAATRRRGRSRDLSLVAD